MSYKTRETRDSSAALLHARQGMHMPSHAHETAQAVYSMDDTPYHLPMRKLPGPAAGSVLNLCGFPYHLYANCMACPRYLDRTARHCVGIPNRQTILTIARAGVNPCWRVGGVRTN